MMRKRLKTLLTEGGIRLTTVILFAVICGAAVGALMLVPILKDTSFRQPGISFEFWIFAALVIALRSKTPLEAGLKTFVFFLISQPLIYLVQVPFSPMGWQIFSYYPRWALLTVFTLPGGMAAWFVKKGGFIGVLVLSLANLVLCFELPPFVLSLVGTFPRYLVSVLFILAELVLFILVLFDSKKERLFAALIVLLLLAGSAVYTGHDRTASRSTITFEVEGTLPLTFLDDSSDVSVTVDGNTVTAELPYYGGFLLDFTDADGNTVTVSLTADENGVRLNTPEA